jgi:hypothetical protein
MPSDVSGQEPRVPSFADFTFSIFQPKAEKFLADLYLLKFWVRITSGQ